MSWVHIKARGTAYRTYGRILWPSWNLGRRVSGNRVGDVNKRTGFANLLDVLDQGKWPGESYQIFSYQANELENAGLLVRLQVQSAVSAGVDVYVPRERAVLSAPYA